MTRVRADDDVYSVGLIGIGTAHAVFGPDEETPKAAGVLWVPDPEQRRGWRERYVYAETKPGAERRPMGFHKP